MESPAWEAILIPRRWEGNSPTGKVLDDPGWLAGLGIRWLPWDEYLTVPGTPSDRSELLNTSTEGIEP